MSKYKAEPLSRNDIRRYVRKLKKSVGLDDMLMFPIIEFLENIIPMIIPDFRLEIVPKEEMGINHGETYPSKNLIRIREDVYERAVAGVPRDRLTIAHDMEKHGYKVRIEDSRHKFSKAKRIVVLNPSKERNVSVVQVSPGSRRHGDTAYVKVSTTNEGKYKIVSKKELYISDGKETAKIYYPRRKRK